jgi:DUF917 family protein
VATALGGRLLASGRVVEVTRHGPPSRFGRGTVAVHDTASGTVLRIEMENEYLLALADGAVVATTPDVLCVLDGRTGEPIQCDRIRAGGKVDVAQLPAAPFWRRPAVIERVGPRAFGLDTDPVLLDGVPL